MSKSELQQSIDVDQIDLDEIIGDYSVENVEAFKTYLKHLWKDLCGREEKGAKGLDKITFSKYYELPGIISSRLFETLKNGKGDYLDQDSFINGMVNLFSGDFEKLIKLVFKIYDFDNDGVINKEDIRRVLSYVPIKSKTKKQDLKFEKGNFEDHVEVQKELHDKLDTVFLNKETFNLEDFQATVQKENSDIFLFILVFILKKRPFNNETVRLLENIKKSPIKSPQKSPKSQKILIASPNLNSKLTPSTTIQKSPKFSQGRTLGNPSGQKNALNIYSGKKNLGVYGDQAPNLNYDINKKTSNQDNDCACISLDINGGIVKNQSKNNQRKDEDSNFSSRKCPKRKTVKDSVDDLDKAKTIKKSKEVDSKEADVELQEARFFEASNNNNNKKNDEELLDEGSDDEEEKNNNTVEGYLYKYADDKIKMIYFRLICKDLYFYKSKEETKHRGMHNLSGAYVHEEPNAVIKGKKFYSFSITFPSKKRIYYCDDEKQRHKWYEGIRKSIGYSNLGDIYEMKEVLGKGKFGLVRLGIHKKLKRKVAIKLIKKETLTPKDLQLMNTEIEILKIAHHPNIIKLYDVFENENYIYIIMEYCEGGDLFYYLEKRKFKIPEKRAAEIIHKLCTAVYFLHEYGVVHRDLKPENILMVNEQDDADIKLMDFGLSKIMGPNEYCHDSFGTLSYVAPEILLGNDYNSKVDLWSIGIIAYLLLAGFLPFDDEYSDKEIGRQTVNEPTPFPSIIWQNISIEGKNFVDNLLSKDPEKRMTIKEVLEHSWLQKFCGASEKEAFVKRKKSREMSGGDAFKVYATPKIQTEA